MKAKFAEDFGEEGTCDTGPRAHNPNNWQVKDKARMLTPKQDRGHLDKAKNKNSGGRPSVSETLRFLCRPVSLLENTC